MGQIFERTSLLYTSSRALTRIFLLHAKIWKDIFSEMSLKRYNFLIFIPLLLVVYSAMVIKPSVAQGFDAGPADPLQFGLIDPVILELGATYL